VKVAELDRTIDRRQPDFIGGADSYARLNAAARHPNREALR